MNFDKKLTTITTYCDLFIDRAGTNWNNYCPFFLDDGTNILFNEVKIKGISSKETKYWKVCEVTQPSGNPYFP